MAVETDCGGCTTTLNRTNGTQGSGDFRCAVGAGCMGNTCMCTASNPNLCPNLAGVPASTQNGYCTNHASNLDNCGSCGRSCPAAGTNNYPSTTGIATPIPVPAGSMIRNNPGARNCTTGNCICGQMPVFSTVGGEATGYAAVNGTICTPAGAPSATGPYPTNTACTDQRLDPNHCGGCALTNGNAACRQNGVCSNGLCAPRSCRDIYQARLAYYGVRPTNGIYILDPDGAGGVAEYRAFCEMENFQGATLVLKIDGTNSTFTYASTRWTNNTAGQDLNFGDIDLSYSTSEGRHPAYRLVNVGESNSPTPVRLPALAVATRELQPNPGPSNMFRRAALNVGALANGRTLFSLVNGAPTAQTGAQTGGAVHYAFQNGTATFGGLRQFWSTDLYASSGFFPNLQLNCNIGGFNVTTNNGGQSYRLGFFANSNPNNCTSSDSGAGFGGANNAVSANRNSQPANNYGTGADGSANQNMQVFAWIFVR